MREPTMQSNDGLYPDKRVLAHRTQDENLASPKNITSKLDMAFGPAKIQRPQSSGNKDLAAGFQYSTAKKVQPVLNIHGKLGVAGVLPDSLRQRHMQPAAGNDELGHSPRAKDLIHIEHESAIDRTIETGDVSSANIKLHGSNIPLQFPPGNPPQSDSVPFNLRPELRPLKAFGSGKVMTNSDNLMQSIEVDAKSSLESSCTDAQIQADGQIEPVENSGIDKTPTKKNRDHSSSLQKLHVVKGASRVNKAKHVQGGRSRTPQTLQGISQLDLTNEQILELFLSNFRKEKIQSTGLQSQMKHQIEQLVRVNGDYQTKLEEAEQEIEMQGREILKYKDKLSKWKQDLLHLNSRMGGLVEDHSAMNMSIKQLKDAKKDYLSSRASATKDIEKSRGHLAIMRGELTQLNALVHDYEHTTKSIVAKLDLMEDKYKQKASQLLKEETRTVRLEAFVEHEIKQLRTQSPLFNKTLEQFMGRISAMEHMIEQLNRLNIDTVKTTGTRGENPDIAACIELLRRLHDAERVMPSDIDKLGASIAKLEERFAEIAQNGSRCTQIASEANRALGINLDKQLTEIKESIATSKASLEEQEQLQFQLVRLDEATKQQRTLIAEVGKAKEFAEQQATLPQVDVRTLLQHIESLQASLTEHSKTAQEQRELQVTTDMRKIANLKSSLEDEKKKNTTLTKELDSSKLAAYKKEEMLGSLSGELVSVKEQQRELGKGSEQAQKRLEEKQLDEKTANISVLEIRLTELNTKSTLQVATIDDLRAKLGQEIVSKEELKAKIELLESVKQELEEARQTSSSRLALIQEQEVTIKASEGVQRELDVQLAERAKLNDRVASLEQRSKDYENLKAKYKSLEIEAAELQASRVQNLQLNSELIEKSSEQAKLKDRIQELETKIIQSQHLTRPFIHPSQGSPEITSQDLTPGTKAAFDELIEPDMLDGDGFSNDHPRSEQRKSRVALRCFA
ncbi:hypothetical protein UCRPC4_g06694 [Phaeomoniella chlamydospora]|uniref:Uncharacterized protein n=1 Tax=Phaeomoniella chlamydospora TaxID=158046 RepID=A0A0G2FRN7_PHACM|nr:hypothetical protein UCRPC4_g06694 [Phaeomoniella chlamydospora]